MAWQLYVLKFPNGKLYFGITSRGIPVRWATHCKIARLNPKLPVHLAIARFGTEAVEVGEIAAGTEDEIRLAEFAAIETFGTRDREKGYNLAYGGWKAPSSAPEVREKIRAAMTGKTIPDDVRAKMSAAGLGRRKSAEHRAKIGAGNRGKKRSPEDCAKPRGSFKGLRHSPETLAKMREAQRRRYARERAERESV